MLTITDRAQDVVRTFIESDEDGRRALRIVANPGAGGVPQFELSLVSESEQGEDDVRVDMGDFSVLFAKDQQDQLDGVTVDFVERVNESGFEVRPATRSTPRAEGPPMGELADKVKEVLDSQVNPAVASHGGEIVLIDVKGSEVFIEMGGGCQGCALSRMTLKQGVERMLRQAVPEVTAVHDVTDHTSGENPFY